MAINDKEEGTIRIAASSISTSTTSVSFTFTAKETTDASAFTVSNLITENREELTTDNVTVKVVEKAEEPQPEQPSDDQNQNTTVNPGDTVGDEETGDASENANKSDADAPKVDEDGNVITKLPQTGVTGLPNSRCSCSISNSSSL